MDPDRPTRRFRRALARRAAEAAVFLAVVGTVPRLWCGRDAGAWYEGDERTVGGLASQVEAWVDVDLTAGEFRTGSARFDGEWLFGTYMMAAMGLGQTGRAGPASRAIDRLLEPACREFDRAAWGEDPLETLESDRGHAAYLGYLNLALGLVRALDPATPHRALHDRVTEALARRLDRNPIGLVETYPGEVYPVDNAAAIGSLALHARATGSPPPQGVRAWSERCRREWIDPATGLLWQAVSARDGRPVDGARGSGTALAAYFLSFADLELSAELHRAVVRELAGSVAGFGVVREYPAGAPGGGDIDSGPIVAGYGVSATGFALAGCRIHGDRDLYESIYRTVDLFGGPVDLGKRRAFATGGPLGDAILFAMLTARRTP